MSPERRRTPDYLLERAAAGDLPATERVALLDALAREPGGQARLDALARDDEATLARLPPDRFAARVTRRARPRMAPAVWGVFPATAIAAAVALVLLVRPGGAPGPIQPADVTRAKGLAPHLVVHRARGGSAARLEPGAPALPGELLQVGYVAAGKRFGVIVSIDGRGAVTLHWPLGGPTAGALSPRREALLPESFKLDDAPAFERFFLVASDTPFPVEEVLGAARALARRPDAGRAPLPVGPDLAVSSLLVPKEVR